MRWDSLLGCLTRQVPTVVVTVDDKGPATAVLCRFVIFWSALNFRELEVTKLDFHGGTCLQLQGDATGFWAGSLCFLERRGNLSIESDDKLVTDRPNAVQIPLVGFE